MGFSFAASDLLLEVDAAGNIVFAAGAAGPLGERDAHAFVGRAIGECVREDDRPMLGQMLSMLKLGMRSGPLQLVGAGAFAPTMQISAVTLPTAPNARYVTIAFTGASTLAAAVAPRAKDTGLVEAEAYGDVAEDALSALRARGSAAKVTMLDLAGQQDLVTRLGPDEARSYLGELGAMLRAASSGDAAAQVTDGSYSVIHDETLDTEALTRDLGAAAKKADPQGLGVQIGARSITIDPDLSDADAARALAYAVARFAEGGLGGDSDFSELCSTLEGDMRQTSSKMVAFKRTISERQFIFMAQPIVNLKSRRPHHYELLVRFEKGRSPFQMVHFAEQTGVIADLDMAALEAAVAFLAKRAPRDFPGLAVNLSGASVTNPQFATRLIRALIAHNVDPKRLSFEITESSRITDLDAAHAFIQRIRNTGHPVYLDDFGAGAASFQYLRALEVDAVKIDGAYVQSAAQLKKDALLLKAMVELCRDLGVLTVAEKVENETQVQHLAKLGVDMCQGYLFGKPAPLSTLAADKAA